MVNLFFFNDTATTEIYTLSLHDALPISQAEVLGIDLHVRAIHPVAVVELGLHAVAVDLELADGAPTAQVLDRKSTRLNSSHANISYAVFCLKKKKKLHSAIT